MQAAAYLVNAPELPVAIDVRGASPAKTAAVSEIAYTALDSRDDVESARLSRDDDVDSEDGGEDPKKSFTVKQKCYVIAPIAVLAIVISTFTDNILASYLLSVMAGSLKPLDENLSWSRKIELPESVPYRATLQPISNRRSLQILVLCALAIAGFVIDYYSVRLNNILPPLPFGVQIKTQFGPIFLGICIARCMRTYTMYAKGKTDRA